MTINIDTLIAEMEQTRARLNEVMDNVLPYAELYPSWKLKQVLDHITGWDELVITTLHAYQQGEIPTRSVKTINQYNDASVTARQALSLEQSRRAYKTARLTMLETLRQLPPELFTQEFKAPWGGKCTIPGILKIFISHEQEHANHIEKTIETSK
jgi:hypothetical protein